MFKERTDEEGEDFEEKLQNVLEGCDLCLLLIWFGLVFILGHSISSLGFLSFSLSQGRESQWAGIYFNFLIL